MSNTEGNFRILLFSLKKGFIDPVQKKLNV